MTSRRSVKFVLASVAVVLVVSGIGWLRAEEGKPKFVIEDMKERVTCLAFSRDSKLLATGGEDKTVRLWDMATGKEAALLKKHDVKVNCLAFSPDGKWLAAGYAVGDSAKPAIFLFDVKARKAVDSFVGVSSPRCLAFAPDSKILAAIGSGRVLRTWDIDGTPRHEGTYYSEGRVGGIPFTADGKRIVLWETGATCPTAQYYHVKDLKTAGNHVSVEGLAFEVGVELAEDNSPLLWTIVSEQGKHHFAYYQPAEGPTLKRGVRVKLPNDVGNQAVPAYSHKGQCLAVRSSLGGENLLPGNDIFLYRLLNKDGEVRVRQLAVLPLQYPGLEGLALSPDGTLLAGGYEDGTVTVWEVPAPR